MSSIRPVRSTYLMLSEHHYLGPTKTADFAWVDGSGCIVFAKPRSRNVPGQWLELVRWCLLVPGGGSRQWSAFVRWAKVNLPEVTTFVSYSDPSQGHTGSLYRACGWLWAPTWHRLRPPPSGNGNWGTGQQAVKDRWIFPLTRDANRAAALAIKDAAVTKRMPWAEYREPHWQRGRFNAATGGGDYKRWRACQQ